MAPMALQFRGMTCLSGTYDAIGEHTTTGATIATSLITGVSNPVGIAILGNDLFVAIRGTGTVGEYTTSGTTVNASLISELTDWPYGIVTSRNDFFVVNGSNVREDTTSGVTVDASLISGLDDGSVGIAITPVPIIYLGKILV